MTRIQWDQVGERFYEGGVSKGVLYLDDGSGVPWNGLIAVEESVSTTVDPVYFDGVKFNDVVVAGDFSATLRAYTYPEEFLPFEGTIEGSPGVFVTEQPPKQFDMSYQTRIGNDVEGLEHGYLIHILYNLTAIPQTKSYTTVSQDEEAVEFEWEITAIPEAVGNYTPTAHIIIDSRKIDSFLLADLEANLYGDDEIDAKLPSLNDVAKFLDEWGRVIITSTSSGIWTARAQKEGLITMLDETTFQITGATIVILDADTYEISSTEKNEDTWIP